MLATNRTALAMLAVALILATLVGRQLLARPQEPPPKSFALGDAIH